MCEDLNQAEASLSAALSVILTWVPGSPFGVSREVETGS